MLIIGFTSNIVYMGVLVFVVVAALGQLGIQTTSFIAILGAAGFLLIIFRPFKEGDVKEAAGVVGKADLIQIFTTTLKTPDNKTAWN